MASPGAKNQDEVEGLDEEYLFHVKRGADLLAKGQPDQALAALERARELRPRDSQLLGLLGQARYKLGRYTEAVEAYGRLVQESPAEPSARVNLGLANIKARRYAEAVSQLEMALELNPGHKKAMGYLGLAWLEQGEPAQARPWFERAGSEQMVARCDELLGGSRSPPTAEPPPQPQVRPAPPPEAEPPAAPAPVGQWAPPPERAPEAPAAPTPPRAWPEPSSEAAAAAEPPPLPETAGAAAPEASRPEPAPQPLPPPEPDVEAAALAAAAESAPAVELAPPSGQPAPAAAPAVQLAPAAPAVPPPLPSGAPPSLSALVQRRLIAPAAIDTFAVGQALLTIAVNGEVLARSAGLLAVRGTVRLTPEMKRFRGRATDKPFGAGEGRVVRASGEGALLYRGDLAHFTPIDLAGEAGYFREENVFALESSLVFENGRVASKSGADLHLVHLRGKGRFLLSTAGEIFVLEVHREAPLRVPIGELVGWSGALTPRIVPLVEATGGGHQGGTPQMVELVGEGRALVDSGPGPG